MKKILLTLVCFLICSTLIHAQTTFGVKAGVSGYDLRSNVTHSDLKIGGFGGVFARLPVTENFSVQPEVVFSMEGAKGKGKITEGNTFFGDRNLNYINLPVMFQFNTSSGIFFEAGPQVGFLISAKSKLEIGNSSQTNDVKDLYKKTSIGAGFGAGYRLPIGFGITGRYNLGLSNIVDGNDADVKTSGFQLGLTYNFGERE